MMNLFVTASCRLHYTQFPIKKTHLEAAPSEQWNAILSPSLQRRLTRHDGLTASSNYRFYPVGETIEVLPRKNGHHRSYILYKVVLAPTGVYDVLDIPPKENELSTIRPKGYISIVTKKVPPNEAKTDPYGHYPREIKIKPSNEKKSHSNFYSDTLYPDTSNVNVHSTANNKADKSPHNSLSDTRKLDDPIDNNSLRLLQSEPVKEDKLSSDIGFDVIPSLKQTHKTAIYPDSEVRKVKFKGDLNHNSPPTEKANDGLEFNENLLHLSPRLQGKENIYKDPANVILENEPQQINLLDEVNHQPLTNKAAPELFSDKESFDFVPYLKQTHKTANNPNIEIKPVKFDQNASVTQKSNVGYIDIQSNKKLVPLSPGAQETQQLNPLDNHHLTSKAENEEYSDNPYIKHSIAESEATDKASFDIIPNFKATDKKAKNPDIEIREVKLKGELNDKSPLPEKPNDDFQSNKRLLPLSPKPLEKEEIISKIPKDQILKNKNRQINPIEEVSYHHLTNKAGKEDFSDIIYIKDSPAVSEATTEPFIDEGNFDFIPTLTQTDKTAKNPNVKGRKGNFKDEFDYNSPSTKQPNHYVGFKSNKKLFQFFRRPHEKEKMIYTIPTNLIFKSQRQQRNPVDDINYYPLMKEDYLDKTYMKHSEPFLDRGNVNSIPALNQMHKTGENPYVEVRELNHNSPSTAKPNDDSISFQFNQKLLHVPPRSEEKEEINYNNSTNQTRQTKRQQINPLDKIYQHLPIESGKEDYEDKTHIKHSGAITEATTEPILDERHFDFVPTLNQTNKTGKEPNVEKIAHNSPSTEMPNHDSISFQPNQKLLHVPPRPEDKKIVYKDPTNQIRGTRHQQINPLDKQRYQPLANKPGKVDYLDKTDIKHSVATNEATTEPFLDEGNLNFIPTLNQTNKTGKNPDVEIRELYHNSPSAEEPNNHSQRQEKEEIVYKNPTNQIRGTRYQQINPLDEQSYQPLANTPGKVDYSDKTDIKHSVVTNEATTEPFLDEGSLNFIPTLNQTNKTGKNPEIRELDYNSPSAEKPNDDSQRQEKEEIVYKKPSNQILETGRQQINPLDEISYYPLSDNAEEKEYTNKNNTNLPSPSSESLSLPIHTKREKHFGKVDKDLDLLPLRKVQQTMPLDNRNQFDPFEFSAPHFISNNVKQKDFSKSKTAEYTQEEYPIDISTYSSIEREQESAEEKYPSLFKYRIPLTERYLPNKFNRPKHLSEKKDKNRHFPNSKNRKEKTYNSKRTHHPPTSSTTALGVQPLGESGSGFYYIPLTERYIDKMSNMPKELSEERNADGNFPAHDISPSERDSNAKSRNEKTPNLKPTHHPRTSPISTNEVRPLRKGLTGFCIHQKSNIPKDWSEDKEKNSDVSTTIAREVQPFGKRDNGFYYIPLAKSDIHQKSFIPKDMLEERDGNSDSSATTVEGQPFGESDYTPLAQRTNHQKFNMPKYLSERRHRSRNFPTTTAREVQPLGENGNDFYYVHRAPTFKHKKYKKSNKNGEITENNNNFTLNQARKETFADKIHLREISLYFPIVEVVKTPTGSRNSFQLSLIKLKDTFNIFDKNYIHVRYI